MFSGQQDPLILKEAAARGAALVTYDLRTIPPLLKSWIEEGRDHGGVIFVDDKTIPPSNFGLPSVPARHCSFWSWARVRANFMPSFGRAFVLHSG